jgi:PhnB protein
MSRTSTYLNFSRHTEAAFTFYRQVFGTEFIGQIARLGDVPAMDGQPPIAEADKQLIMHIELPLLGGHVLMGTDAPESMGFKLTMGDNVHINLEADSLTEAKKLFKGLSDGGLIDTPLQEMFWGAYHGAVTDKFGVHWMFACPK